MVDGNCVCSGTVPSEAGPLDEALRKIANPLSAPELLTSAHPVTVDANWPVVMSKVAFEFIVAITDEVVVFCVVPWFVVVIDKLNALPSSLWNATITGTAVNEVLTSVITVVQAPPAAMWERTPERTSAPVSSEHDRYRRAQCSEAASVPEAPRS